MDGRQHQAGERGSGRSIGVVHEPEEDSVPNGQPHHSEASAPFGHYTEPEAEQLFQEAVPVCRVARVLQSTD